MRVEKVAQQEEEFKQNLTNANGTKYKLITKIPMEKGLISVIRPGYDSYFYQEETEKSKIVLHYTIGHLKGDLATLNKKDYHVSVPYLIARNGTVYELFDPDCWAYHLGKGAAGGNKIQTMTLARNDEQIGAYAEKHGEPQFEYDEDE